MKKIFIVLFLFVCLSANAVEKKTNFSIDRLDSTKTYTPKNLVFCCIGCNNRKNAVRLSDIVNITKVWKKRRTL